jgi:hypothetical protein
MGTHSLEVVLQQRYQLTVIRFKIPNPVFHYVSIDTSVKVKVTIFTA